MNTTVKVKDMLDFLKENWTYAHELLQDFGADDPRAKSHTSWCIGMKEMIECLACIPVNLKRDGRVTIGLDEEVDV